MPLENTVSGFSVREYLDYGIGYAARLAVKPVAVSLTAFVFVVAGGLGITNASFYSLPGDAMYPVKLSMEHLQLSISSDDAQRAKLQVEFAGRRLEEMTDLAARSGDQVSNIQYAMNQFRQETRVIQDELTSDSTDLAREVSRKVEIYNSTVSASPDLKTELVGEEVQEIIEATQDQAVEVFLSTHESTQDAESAKELDYTFDQEYSALESELETFTADQEKDFFTQFNTTSTAYLILADQLRDQAAYRRAFQILSEIEMFLQVFKETS
ncbi:TPA: hypothetical protein DEP34_00120 [Candidatus Uhrbacteria bacterium]|nr:hypothetical protein [Candidatus Uhrbacteria bacterium]HCB18778.1 hypothetical protein [Candidatus Uhrbacteria bacterium]